MLQQGMSDLEFDAYFNVTSNPMHPQHHNQQQHHPQQLQQGHYDQAIHPTQQLVDMPQRMNPPLLIPQLHQQQQQQQQPYYMPQQQQQQQAPSFEMFDWCFKQQQQQPSQHQHGQMLNNAHHTPVSTPGSNGIHQTSPRSEYFYSAQQQQSQHHHQSNSSPRFQMQQNAYNNNATFVSSSEQGLPPPPQQQQPQEQPVAMTTTSHAPVIPPVNVAMATNATGLPTPMSDVIFPGTPQSRTSIHSTESNSPCSTSEPTAAATVSPVLDIPPPPLTNAFAAIDQWGKSNQDEAIPEVSKENYHETRHWRKTKRSDSISSNTSNMVAAAVAAVAARSAPRNASPIETGRQLKKVAHNAIERRYRNNINDRIRDLKNVVPALYKAKIREKKSRSNSKSNTEEDDDEAAAAESSDDNDDDASSTKTGEIVDGVEVAKKLNKATILHKATEYIHHLKHTNELAERENQVLQQILAQMPGGSKVLARFQVQKLDFQQAEQQRLLAERKECMERERAERQRMLRERAAQRAALAELLPKPERRPYRRRAKKNEAAATTTDDKQKSTKDDTQEQAQGQETAAGSLTTTTTASSSSEPSTSTDTATTTTTTTTSTDTSGNKAFMAMFLCLAIVSPLSFENTAAQPYHGSRALSQQQQQQPISIRSLPSATTPSTFEYCLWAKIAFILLLISYFLGHYVLKKRQERKTLH